MRTHIVSQLALAMLLSLFTLSVLAQQPPAGGAAPGPPKPSPKETEVWEPVPKIVTPAPASESAPPSDAVILFDGKNLDEWVNSKGKGPAGWIVADGVFTVDKKVGNIQTKRDFTNYQIHLEWRVPSNITGKDQARGNSGLFLAAPAGVDVGYELQILDSYQNTTYVNGQAASIYKQSPPLVNAMRKPGEWQVYDVIWTAPTFNADGSVKTPAYLTAFHNGILVQNHVALKGGTAYIGQPKYLAHGPAPIQLQSHGDPSEPLSFRNVWLRELP